MAAAVLLLVHWPGLRTWLVLELLALGDKNPLRFHQRAPEERQQTDRHVRDQTSKERYPPGHSRVWEGTAVCVGSSLIHFSDNYSSFITNRMTLDPAQPGRREGITV